MDGIEALETLQDFIQYIRHNQKGGKVETTDRRFISLLASEADGYPLMIDLHAGGYIGKFHIGTTFLEKGNDGGDEYVSAGVLLSDSFMKLFCD